MRRLKIILFALLVACASRTPVRATVLDQEMLSTEVQECAPGFVSGNTVFIYIDDGSGCRPFLVYSATYLNLFAVYPDIFSWDGSRVDPRFPGWRVVYRIGGGDSEDVVLQSRQQDGQLVERIVGRRPWGDGVHIFESVYRIPERFAW